MLAVLMVLSVAVTVGAASTSEQSGIGNPVGIGDLLDYYKNSTPAATSPLPLGATTTISTPHGTAPALSVRDSRSSSYTTAR